MILGLVFALACGEPPRGLLTHRIAESCTAAQAQQGPLDGHWRLFGEGMTRDVELLDPPSNPARLGGAWRDAEGSMGAVQVVRRSRDEIELVFDGEPGKPLRLQHHADGTWRGERGGRQAILARRLARGG